MEELRKDELHEILTSSEMRTKKENRTRKEVAFKATRKSKCRKKEQKDPFDIPDKEESNFTRKLKRGSIKYKGVFLFKCFKYGKICHFKCLSRKTKIVTMMKN